MRRTLLPVLFAVSLAGLMPAQVGGAPALAPQFTVELLDGKTLSLADMKGSPVILLFWAPW
jgi:hypothetical protein